MYKQKQNLTNPQQNDQKQCDHCENRLQCQCHTPTFEVNLPQTPILPTINTILPLEIEQGPEKIFCNPQLAMKIVPRLFHDICSRMSVNQAIAYLMAVMDDHLFIENRKRIVQLVRSLVVARQLPSNFDNTDKLKDFINTTSNNASKILRRLAPGYMAWTAPAPGKEICIQAGLILAQNGYPYAK